MSFAGSQLSHARFAHAQGEQLEFDRSRLDYCRLHHTDFSQASFRGAKRRKAIGTDPVLLAAEARTLLAEQNKT